MSSSVVAVVGGGQLARMMQRAAIGLDVHLRTLVASGQDPAAQVVPDAPVGDPGDPAALRALAAGAHALTFEHEHVPRALLEDLVADGVAVRPGPAAFACTQDKLHMRRTLDAVGVPAPRWAQVGDTEALADFLAGGPGVVKTPTGGYDGHGVRTVDDPGQVADWWGTGPLLAEERVDFVGELAALVARRPGGRTSAWPVARTVQREGMCAEVHAPAPGLDPLTEAQAQDVARTLAEALDVVGLLAVEMFELRTPRPDGARVVVNELAMRPHNSGHWTLDGSATDQFSQHLRAVLDWPLGPTEPTSPVTVMVNVLGSRLADPTAALPRLLAAVPEARVQWYGKQVRPGRKLGHVNVTGADAREVAHRARLAAAILQGQEADGA